MASGLLLKWQIHLWTLKYPTLARGSGYRTIPYGWLILWNPHITYYGRTYLIGPFLFSRENSTAGQGTAGLMRGLPAINQQEQ